MSIMKTDKSNYYEYQINRINFKGEYPAKVKLFGGGDESHYLNLNSESAQILINKLKSEFNLK